MPYGICGMWQVIPTQKWDRQVNDSIEAVSKYAFTVKYDYGNKVKVTYMDNSYVFAIYLVNGTSSAPMPVWC